MQGVGSGGGDSGIRVERLRFRDEGLGIRLAGSLGSGF